MILEESDESLSAVINPDMVVEKIENFPEVKSKIALLAFELGLKIIKGKM